MKMDVKTSFIQLDKDELKQLCCEVKETVATGIVLPDGKAKESSFGIADLWSMQRKMKTAGRAWSNRHRIILIRG